MKLLPILAALFILSDGALQIRKKRQSFGRRESSRKELTDRQGSFDSFENLDLNPARAVFPSAPAQRSPPVRPSSIHQQFKPAPAPIEDDYSDYESSEELPPRRPSSSPVRKPVPPPPPQRNLSPGTRPQDDSRPSTTLARQAVPRPPISNRRPFSRPFDSRELFSSPPTPPTRTAPQQASSRRPPPPPRPKSTSDSPFEYEDYDSPPQPPSRQTSARPRPQFHRPRSQRPGELDYEDEEQNVASRPPPPPRRLPPPTPQPQRVRPESPQVRRPALPRGPPSSSRDSPAEPPTRKRIVIRRPAQGSRPSQQVVRRRITTTTTQAPPLYEYEYDDPPEPSRDYEDIALPQPQANRNRPFRRGGGRPRRPPPRPHYDYYDDYEALPKQRQRPQTTTTTTTTTPATTSPPPTTTTPKPRNMNLKPRKDGRYIDYLSDPNFPRELKGSDLTDYPFYITVPEDINFKCEDYTDGFYASIPHKCQLFHYCFGGARFDFLCPNFTLYDQTTFTCRFVNHVDCPNAHLHYSRNEALYVETTTPDLRRERPPSRKSRPNRNKKVKKPSIKTTEGPTETTVPPHEEDEFDDEEDEEEEEKKK